MVLCGLLLPRDLVFGHEGGCGGGCAALRGGERGGVDAAVGGGALEITAELQVTPPAGARAHLVPLLVTVGGAGGVTRERVAAGLAG